MDRTMIEVKDAAGVAAGLASTAGAPTHASSGGAGTNNNAKATSPISYSYEEPPSEEDSIASDSESPSFRKQSSSMGNSNQQQGGDRQNTQDMNHTLRPLGDFLFEDPTVYTSEEIKEVLDMINDGNLRENHARETYDDQHGNNNQQQKEHMGGGLKPICKAYGILGFIRFLDCYYLTLITKRAKVGCIGGNSIYTVKVSSCMMSSCYVFVFDCVCLGACC